MPERIQLKRTKGWRMPENTVSVARPSYFGNPFKVRAAQDALGLSQTDAVIFCVEEFRKWLRGDRDMWQGIQSDDAASIILRRLPELKGKNLGCFCPLDQPCHADVLLELANPQGEAGNESAEPIPQESKDEG